MANLIKKVLLIGGIGLLAFPIMFIIFMFMEGQLRIEKGPQKVKAKEDIDIMKYTPVQDSLAAVHSKTFESLVKQEKRMQEKERQLAKREERLRMLDQRLKEQESLLENKKKEIEKIVKSSETLEAVRIKTLARIYGSMRPEEAASILETLPDQLLISILKSIGEDRQKAKIMERMERGKASRISKMMGENELALHLEGKKKK